jgi:hypothetical protein
MAKAKEKSKYQGPKLGGDTAEYREAARKRAEKNAQGDHTTNDMFATSDTHFRELCEKAGVKPTKRQASKFRNKYGAAAREAGINKRKNPVTA